MISFWTDRDQRSCFTRKSPLAFFTNLFKKKKYGVGKLNGNDDRNIIAPKVPTTLSVSVMDMRMTSPCPLSPALSTLTLTPGRTRDIDQDMEALRLSRQDNPFLQVLASRESLVESLFESESDDTNLMSQEFPNDLEVDPLSLPEIHEHMIRSPPPTTWPKSPNYKVFRFPIPGPDECTQVNNNQTGSYKKSPVKILSPRQMKAQLEENCRVLKYNEFGEHDIGCYSTIHSTHSPRTSIIQRPHQRSSSECRDRSGNPFPVFRPTPMRSLSDVRRLQSNGNSEEHKVEDLERRFDHDSPLTLPLLSKRST